MPDNLPYNMREIERLQDVGRGLGRILIKRSSINGDDSVFDSLLDEYVGFTSSVDVTRVEDMAVTCKKKCSEAGSLDEKISIFERSINDAKEYLDHLKAIYGAAPSTSDYVCAGSLLYYNGNFYINNEEIDITGQPGRLLLAFLKSRNHFLTRSEIEQLDDEYVADSAARRIDKLKDKLSKTRIGRYCIEFDSIRDGYKLRVD